MGLNMVELKSKKFILRYPTMKDLQAIYDFDTESLAKKMFMSSYKNLREAKKELTKIIKVNKSKRKESEHFIVEVDGKAAGHFWLSLLAYTPKDKHKASIGFVIGKKYRGKGIGTAALKLLVNYAFKKYKLKRIATFTRTFNKASRKMFEKAGFKLEGIFRKNKYKDGKYLDDCMYTIVR